ncbi:mitogen-activated protein kinase kinase 3-like [Panicum miliaceum]|uniref:mitogen-activated protein kinase kinase n=1 Tax=Panicum miliaceum TaxID=4540 RepID=A0A3L6RJ50_PANMI|nr:mitogen-activated protein kinase kinase 3-like [Panicum miliaceum]
MDGGSLADIIRVKKFTPEPVLAHMLMKVLPALRYLHEVKHVVHRDIKPANLLVNLKGDVKITYFGVTASLHDSVSTVFYFLVTKVLLNTVTYMSPERIQNSSYSYAADIWSLRLTILECATERFPYCVNGGLSDLMLQILDDPSPTPAKYVYSLEFCSFISACLQKDADARPTCEQLLSHPFINRYKRTGVDLSAYFKSAYDPTEILWQMAHVLAVHYYLIFYGSDTVWRYMKTFYREESVFSFLGEEHIGQSDIFRTLSRIRKMLKGNRPRSKIVHVIERVRCCAHGEEGVAIRVSGSLIVGNELLVCEDGLRAERMPSADEGMPSSDEVPFDIMSKRVGRFREEFFVEP